MRALRVLIAASVLVACSRDPPPAGSACAELAAGDLVISEIMANPDGDDAGHEWFELYNASAGPRSLRGLTLVSAHADGSGEKVHRVGDDAPELAPGAYLVVGDARVESKPDFMAYAYGKDLGTLANGAGRLALRCGATEIDAVSYSTSSEGRSRGLSGVLVPDAVANDDEAMWCTSRSAGTPGAANEPCTLAETPRTCRGAAYEPHEGDLRITEVLANPRATADARGEWFEVEVLRDVDLDGLEIGAELGTPRTTLAAGACAHAAAGTRLVFAHVTDPAQNGGLAQVDQVFGAPALANGHGALVLSWGGTLVDEVAWTGTSAGVALPRDALGSWCPATDAYGAGDLGTPGAANADCPVIVPDGMCQDESGVRPIVPPVAGELQIAEVMADPAAVGDAQGEWLELAASADVDLNGLELGTVAPTVKTRLAETRCLHVAAGGRVLLARSDDPMRNGGLPAVTARFDFALGNGASGLFVGEGGVVLAAVTWAAAVRGASLQVWPDACVTPAGFTYGAGDRGTPGAENVSCE